MKIKWLLLLLLLPIGLPAQVAPQLTGAGAPVGACTSTQQYLDTTNRVLYYCNNNAWGTSQGLGNLTGGGGSATIPAGVGKQNFISATDYGVKAWGHVTHVPVTANASNIITSTDANFTGTDPFGNAFARVGDFIYCTTATTDASQISSTISLAETTISSIDSAAQIHTVGNATGVSGVCVWGPLSSAVFNATQSTVNDPMFAAWQAAQAACLPLQLPAGIMLIEQPEWVTFTSGACATNNAITLSRRGFSIVGAGPNETIVVIMPNMDPTKCTGPNAGGSTCFLALPNPVLQNWQLAGYGNSAPGAGFSGKNLMLMFGISPGVNFTINNFNAFGFGANQTGLKGLNVGDGVGLGISNGTINSSIFENFGATACYINVPGGYTDIYLTNTYCFGGATSALTIQAGNVSSTQGLYGGNLGTISTGSAQGNCINIVANSGTNIIFNSTNDQLAYDCGTGGTATLYMTGAAASSIKAYITNGYYVNTHSGSVGIRVASTNATSNTQLWINNSTIGGPFGLFMSESGTCTGTCKVYDGGNNTWTATTTGFSNATNATFIPNPLSIYSGFAATLAPTCTVTGAGTTATCAPDTNNTNASGTVLLTSAGTGQAALGTVVMTFITPYSNNGQPPSCTWNLDNTGNTAWNARASVIKQANSTTAVTVNWDNNAVAMVAANTFRLGYNCSPR